MRHHSFPSVSGIIVPVNHESLSRKRTGRSKPRTYGGRGPTPAAVMLVCAMAFLCVTSSFASAVAAPVSQAGGDLTAKQILNLVEGKATLAGSGRALLEMIVEKGKSQKVNRLQVMRSDNGEGTTRQLVEFLAPADVRGTKFLSLATPGEEDQMWLYLPAVGRERRIAGSAASGKFMGTDFTFEEISASAKMWEPYKPERMGDETVEGRKCYVLKLTPESSGCLYGSVTLWIWQEGFLPIRIEFFSKSMKLQKVMAFSDLQKDKRGEWQPNTITLQDVSGGSLTTVHILESDDRPVPDDVFTLRYLRKR
ncbi:MAG: outer membrane lipoprotein-sorting protein [Firmicutes bacterium]|nr:outer membrane lipoprotein-sorting protein [Bacillota bacterium]